MLEKLSINPVGDHFTDSQEKSKVCKHVAKAWEKQCISFDQGIDKMVTAQQVIHDIKAPMREFKTVIENNEVMMEYVPSGQQFAFTENSIKNLCALGGMSSWAFEELRTDRTKETKKKGIEVVWKRDNRDADVLQRLINLHLFQEDRFDLDKERLWRTWDNGTLRAVLSKDYIIVNNVWYLESLKKLIPNGLISHDRSDADELYCNILIPDSIRVENDSDYGGMIVTGNSEVGTRRVSSIPSVFRAICANGCIWEDKQGQGINKVHRGTKFNFKILFEQIKKNLNKQIPLLPSIIAQALCAKQKGVNGVNMVKIFGAIANEFRFSKTDALGVLKEYPKEVLILGKDSQSAFGVQASITRYGQTLSNKEWFHMDEVGGQIVQMSQNKWDSIINKAKNMDTEELNNIYGTTV
mgnify:CR=1 FL=1